MPETRTAAPDHERLEILLALALAFKGRRNQTNGEENGGEVENVSGSNALESLAALNKEDLKILREMSARHENLSEQDKSAWQARLLNRTRNKSLLLDKDVHPTQIGQTLANEPLYLQKFILRHLPPETSAEIASLLEISRESEDERSGENVNPILQNLLRRKFLSNFVSREELFEQKPVSLLSGEDLLQLLQQMGQRELALVCRGISEIENLAPFLRQFGEFDARAIVEQMAKLGAVEQRRVNQAEHLVKEAWQREPEPVLVTQFIGIWKLAGALAPDNPLHCAYTRQKLPVNLSAKLQERLDLIREKLLAGDPETEELANIFESEVETTASKILLRQIPNFSDSEEN